MKIIDDWTIENNLTIDMKRFILCFVAVLVAITMYGVPAYPGWQTKTLADGTTIEVRQVGDEFCSYWASKDGKLVLEQADGTFVKSEKALPTNEEFQARRTRAREMRVEAPEWAYNGKKRAKAVGSTPNLAPKGVVILVNFTDSKIKEAHTNAVFDNLCNAKEGECTTNAYRGVNYGSAAQYFADQSNGAYRPQFDVIGPVDLPHDVTYYGEDGPEQEDGNRDHDLYLGDFVLDAILAADSLCDFSQYDSNNDGYVDFVYFFYAGIGQAYGGSDETIWPHNSELVSLLAFDRTHGRDDYYVNLNSQWQITSYNLPELDGKYVNNYACSSELAGENILCGIGTLCHEFGHVMGLPDFYDTNYGENYKQGLTPGAWNVMDQGCYNGYIHCPCNYDPWEKYFFGWIEPINLGSEASNYELYANGTAEYNVYQVNASGKRQTATANNQLNYYLENRQRSGWDKFLPGHGMVVWRVDYNDRVWNWNAPNNEAGNPRYTIELISDSWEAIDGKAVTEVEETNGVVTFKYMGGNDPIDSMWIDWRYYDNGKFKEAIGAEGTKFYWGIMLPAGQDHNALTKVAIYERPDNNKQPITIDVYEGIETVAGSQKKPALKLYTETVQPAAGDSFHIITLADTVFFDSTKELWIILSEGTDTHPATTCANTGDANGRWVSLDGVKWEDLALDYSLDFTFMIRAYCERLEQPQEQGVEDLSTNNKRPTTKILRDGQLLILRDGKTYNVLGTLTTND